MSEGEKKVKVLAWWKMPLDILRMSVLRARPVRSIPIASAFIGILMVRRRLYMMRRLYWDFDGAKKAVYSNCFSFYCFSFYWDFYSKCRRVALPLKVRFDEKVLKKEYEICDLGESEDSLSLRNLGLLLVHIRFFSSKQFEVFDIEMLNVKDRERRTIAFYSEMSCVTEL